MRFDNSSLFVNTGRKPLSAMQRRKKNNKNNIFMAFFLGVIVVLCIFVGLIVHVWLNYSEDIDEPVNVVINEQEEKNHEEEENAEITAQKQAEEEAKKKAELEEKKNYKTSGKKTVYSKNIDAAYKKLDGTYSYGYILLNDNKKYICNTEKVTNSTAVSAFLVDYMCAKIYTGEFDYSTNVSGYRGEQLMDNLIRNGSVEAANLLISHFTPERLNSYMSANGYENTYFGGAIGDGSGTSYTTTSDLLALMKKMYEKSSVFPYSDMYNRMKNSNVKSRARAHLPQGTLVANLSAMAVGEMFDAAVVYMPNDAYIFVSMANGYSDDGTISNTAMADGASVIYELSVD